MSQSFRCMLVGFVLFNYVRMLRNPSLDLRETLIFMKNQCPAHHFRESSKQIAILALQTVSTASIHVTELPLRAHRVCFVQLIMRGCSENRHWTSPEALISMKINGPAHDFHQFFKQVAILVLQIVSTASIHVAELPLHARWVCFVQLCADARQSIVGPP